MSILKTLAAIVGSVFLFAGGIYFQAALPYNPTTVEMREPASLSTANHANSKFDSKATQAFKGCIDSRVKNNELTVGKVIVEGRKWSIVSIPCQGESARELYRAIQPYSSEEYVRYHDQRRGVVRFFGRLYPPSQCVQLIGNAHGKETNEYSCSIRIDVDSEITEQLKL